MGSRKYTKARVQMRQKLKSLAAVISFLHHGILTQDGSERAMVTLGKTIKAHARLAEGTAVNGSIESAACAVRITTQNFPRRLKRRRSKVHTTPAA